MFLPCPALKINCSFTRFENHCSVVHLKKKKENTYVVPLTRLSKLLI